MSIVKYGVTGVVFAFGLTMAATMAEATEPTFAALNGIAATPMSAAEMDAVQGKNWFLNGGYSFLANPSSLTLIIDQTVGSSTVQAWATDPNATVTVSGNGFTFSTGN